MTQGQTLNEAVPMVNCEIHLEEAVFLSVNKPNED